MAEKKSNVQNDFILVAAIDIGTTFSGYAFATKGDYNSNPLSAYARNWNNGHYQSLKTSTTVLFNADKTFDSFGFLAESKYTELDGKDKRNWYYFQKFKMILYENMNIDQHTKITEENGKKMPALVVFAAAINHLKSDLLSMCEKQHSKINPESIRWVITVPALWSDKAKFFMREAAQQAGISGDQLEVALEPEAASLYCIEWMKKESERSLESEEKILVLDAGGGTVDVAVHQVSLNNQIHELHPANGGDWGGTRVDMEFKDVLVDIVDEVVFEKFQSHQNDYIDFGRDFEVAKRRDFSTDVHGKIPIRIPSIVNELCNEIHKKSFSEILAENITYKNSISLQRDKLMIDITVFKKLFSKTLSKITNHLSKLLENTDLKDVRTIFMVGGFSECHLLYHAIKTKFPRLRVIVPTEAALSVIRGAVIYGHRPEIFKSRISLYTYGIEKTEPFVRSEHPSEKRIQIDGQYHCDKLFCVHVREGETVTLGQSVSKVYETIDAYQTDMDFKVYATKKKSPKYTDEEGCIYIGKLKVDLSGIKPGKNKTREVKVELIYGGTTLRAVAEDTKTGSIFRGKFVLGSRTRKVAQKDN